jgi:dTDP-D-glucose 4,6-dehydratase
MLKDRQDMTHYAIDASKIILELGWKPSITRTELNLSIGI